MSPSLFASAVPASNSHPCLRPLCRAMLMAGMAGFTLCAQAQQAVADQSGALPEVTVSAPQVEQPPTEGSDSYTVKRSRSATKFSLSPRQTPQSVSVVTRARMEDFHLTSINDVFATTPGVTVDRVETDRTYYTSRGFDITNFMFDGIGIPMTYGLMYGDTEMAMFDRVEIVRGANGLTTSTGDPSATINFIRKRPTTDFQASAALSYGSWNTRRLEADISGAVNEAGTVAARVVASHQEGNSYLDRYRPTRDLFYGVVEANLSSSTLLTLGYSYQKVHGKGAMWGALPLSYTDGTATHYGSNTSTSADWSRMDTEQQRVFAELSQDLSAGWQWKSTVGYNEMRTDSALFYVYGTPNKSTGGGLYAYPSLYAGVNRQAYLDSNLSGKYNLLGREHEFNLGVNVSNSRVVDVSNYGRGIGTELFGQQAFDGSFALPVFDDGTDGSRYTDRRKSVYGATRLNLSDRAKLMLGANYTQADASGYAYGEPHALAQSALSPYVGLTVDLDAHFSVYGNYTKIFNPQTRTDAAGAVLAAARGRSYELGVKGEFADGKLNTSLAVFQVDQSNVAEQAGTIGARAYYRGINARSEGIEYEVSGELTRDWQVGAGVVWQRITGDEGKQVRLYVPRRQLRLSTTYRLPQLEKAKIGASLNYQSKSSYDSSNTAYQGGYSVLNLMASYDISKNLTLSASLNNVLNKQYLTTVYWSQSYYAAPINGTVSLRWKY